MIQQGAGGKTGNTSKKCGNPKPLFLPFGLFPERQIADHEPEHLRDRLFRNFPAPAVALRAVYRLALFIAVFFRMPAIDCCLCLLIFLLYPTHDIF